MLYKSIYKWQKDDLKRQREIMETLYKDYKIVEDIGSEFNLNKKVLRL